MCLTFCFFWPLEIQETCDLLNPSNTVYNTPNVDEGCLPFTVLVSVLHIYMYIKWNIKELVIIKLWVKNTSFVFICWWVCLCLICILIDGGSWLLCSQLPYSHPLMKNNLFIGHVSFYRIVVNKVYCTARSKGFISPDYLLITTKTNCLPLSLCLFSRSAEFRWKSGQHSSLNSHVLNGAKKNQENRLQKVQEESIYTSVDVCEMRGKWTSVCKLERRVVYTNKEATPFKIINNSVSFSAGASSWHPQWVDGCQKRWLSLRFNNKIDKVKKKWLLKIYPQILFAVSCLLKVQSIIWI